MLVVPILYLTSTIILGSYIFAVRRRFLRLSLFLFSSFLIFLFLLFADLLLLIDPLITSFCVIIMLLLSQSVFGVYREKRMALVKKDEQEQQRLLK